MTKDYYKILGVLDDAEDVVIRAAYKALAQKYHPDKWQGDLNQASRSMSEINEAYEVLSNPDKRKAFDATRDKSEYQESGNNQSDLLNSVESDWNRVLEYFPKLKKVAENLSKISKQLEFTYKVILIESKNFDNSADIAQELERHYLEKYFGVDEDILKFAKKLIIANKKEAAKELNQAVKLLGSNVDSRVIITRISTKFNLEENIVNLKGSPLEKAAECLQKFPTEVYAINFLKLLNFSVEKKGLINKFYLIRNAKGNYKMTLDELIRYAKHLSTKDEYLT